MGITQAKWDWYNGYWLIIAIDISVTVIPIIKIVYEEYKELEKIKNSKKAMGIVTPKQTRGESKTWEAK